ncbi:MAG: hypothetical protein WBC74_05635, partial [Candidatus Omnitrophota bacterium]
MEKSAKQKRLLGQELVKAGLLTSEQLEFALKEQRKLKGKSRERLGEIIIRCGFIEEKLMIHFLEKYLDIPYMNLKERDHIDPRALALIPERMARNFKLIGVNVVDGKFHVAMSNPFDVIALDTLRIKTGYKIERWFTQSREIEETIDKFYKDQTIEKSIHEFIDLKQKEAEKEKKVVRVSAKAEHKKLEEEAAQAPVVEFVNQLLGKAVRQGA